MLNVLLNDKNASASLIKRHWNDSEMPYCTGLEVVADLVYNICTGKVISIGDEPESAFSVTVVVNDKQIIRYTHLKSVCVSLGQNLMPYDPIGHAKKFVRFEYCTAELGNGRWPVRVASNTYYKHNPEGLLNGSTKLVVVYNNVNDSEYYDNVELDKFQEDEFTGNRGDDN